MEVRYFLELGVVYHPADQTWAPAKGDKVILPEGCGEKDEVYTVKELIFNYETNSLDCYLV